MGEPIISTEDQLWDVECCSGHGHTIRDGGSHINIVLLNKKAFSKYMAAHDLWLDRKERPPRAAALMCDRCMKEERPPRFAVGKDSDEGVICRVPIEVLADWEY